MMFLFTCFKFSGPEDNVAEYYQQQVEMLEGFTEMDVLAERGFVPRLSEVKLLKSPSNTIN